MTPAEFEFKFTIAYNIFKARHGEPVYLSVSTDRKNELLANQTFYRDHSGYVKYKDLTVSWSSELGDNIGLSPHDLKNRMTF